MKEREKIDFTGIALRAVQELQGVDSIAEAAKYVPVQYFGVMAGKEAPDYQDGTFIVKRADLVAIKRYVEASLREPVDLSVIEKQLGYTRLDVDGLEPADIQQLNQRIHQHALSWTTLERETKVLGSQLDIFAKGFVNTGRDVVRHLKNFAGYKDLNGTVDTLSDSELAELRDIPLNGSDIEKVQSLDKFFKRMAKDVVNFFLAVAEVKGLATEFSRKITEELLPAVKTKLDYVDKAGIDGPAKIEAIKAQLKQLDMQITEKNAEYTSLVGYAFAGLVFGPIGVAITGGIYGSQAETVRKHKNALNESRVELLKSMDRATASTLLSGLAGRLTDMKELMIQAERGAKNLEDVWAIIWVHIVESAERLATARNAFDLNFLVLDLQAVIEPWDVIQGHANALSRVFNETVG